LTSAAGARTTVTFRVDFRVVFETAATSVQLLALE